ncbi:hypothetical protein EV702DRAFT_1196507 [Suillus placidus]|uniref:Uncharacterized protein n=1 Tax=Suillus placidus TaxID=48579 RepID=A0A9P6ZWK4_9AGAM|nr:hypothetical protein EV702DRAFT_1196507 [Suillus placidus]
MELTQIVMGCCLLPQNPLLLHCTESGTGSHAPLLEYVFSRVTPRHYNSILHAIEKLAGKARLSYDYETLQLEVEMPSMLDEPTPVIVENHSWCTISSIQVQDNRLTAHGNLYPANADNAASMDNVTLMIIQGLSRTRDCFVDQCRRADPNTNVSALRTAQFDLPFKWADVLDGLTYAMHATAHDRY